MPEPQLPTISPGQAIQQLLDERGWTQYDLADILGVQQPVVSGIVNGKRPITLDLAIHLASAFGNDPSYWIKLETEFRLFSSDKPENADVVRRAKMYEAAPIKDMIKRRWIQDTDDIALLEKQILGFYRVAALDDISRAATGAARKSTSYSHTKPAERAWMQRVKLVAQAVSANKFSEKALDNTIDQFKKILRFPESVRHIPKMLAEAGIRLVIVEPLARTRIDGVCVWLDKQSPVIGLSLRIDRLDSLWFTLFHEMWHVKNRDGLMTPAIVDSSLTGDGAVSSNDKPETERKADAFAAEALIAPKEMDNFLARVAPLFSRQRIEGFAARLGINPAIVIGQLHHRGEIEWNQHSRDFNVKIRDVMTQTALSDGWGQVLPAVS